MITGRALDFFVLPDPRVLFHRLSSSQDAHIPEGAIELETTERDLLPVEKVNGVRKLNGDHFVGFWSTTYSEKHDPVVDHLNDFACPLPADRRLISQPLTFDFRGWLLRCYRRVKHFLRPLFLGVFSVLNLLRRLFDPRFGFSSPFLRQGFSRSQFHRKRKHSNRNQNSARHGSCPPPVRRSVSSHSSRCNIRALENGHRRVIRASSTARLLLRRNCASLSAQPCAGSMSNSIGLSDSRTIEGPRKEPDVSSATSRADICDVTPSCRINVSTVTPSAVAMRYSVTPFGTRLPSSYLWYVGWFLMPRNRQKEACDWAPRALRRFSDKCVTSVLTCTTPGVFFRAR